MSFASLHPDRIFVFLGPTLSPDEAARHLPARYLEPVRCGDILAYLRLKPKVIAIIDGVFDQNASVWHKEILWAMEQGIQVFGASSMGALRAAELSYFGMQGIGEIFTAYRNGKYTDDDEVAVIHQNAAQQFRCLSDAMVNIRATVAHAVSQKVIDSELGEQIVHHAKQTFYPQRLLQHTIAALMQEGTDAAGLERFKTFIKNGGFVDRKRLDAIELLQLLNSMVMGQTPLPLHSPIMLNKSMFIVELQARVALRPLRIQSEWLPVPERVCQEARLLGATYWQLQNLAGLLRWCGLLADRLNLQPSVEDIADSLNSEDFGLAVISQSSDWAIDLDLDLPAKQAFFHRMGQIQALRRTTVGRHGKPTNSLKYENFLQKLIAGKEIQSEVGNIQPTQRKDNSIVNISQKRLKLLQQVAFLWSLAVQCSDREKISLQPNIVKTIERNLLKKYGFCDSSHWQTWIQHNQLSWSDTANPMMELIQLEGMVNQHRWWSWMVGNIDLSLCFLLDAIRLSGFYPLLKKRIQPLSLEQKHIISDSASSPEFFKQWCDENVSSAPHDSEQIAFWLDFSHAEDFLRILDSNINP